MYNFKGFKIEKITTEACYRLTQYGKGLLITCKCSVCSQKNQTPEEAKIIMDIKHGKI